ncbi:hypothetical protein TNIN_273301 [Trichonephila inaurata madagascariensis]|uniref:Uncharacterized protein n=1 Tax=Trichonephila inaurata madagascariensis TaxID=2747483 RepID=A0A8X6MDV8_9ARAC|nr:hypothetical protein TNIN_273301 [Trichonephila inaurata madagascariensis]
MWKGICRKEHDTKCSSDNRARSHDTNRLHSSKIATARTTESTTSGCFVPTRYSGAKSRSAKQSQEKKPDRNRCTTELERSMSDHKARARISQPQECRKGGFAPIKFHQKNLTVTVPMRERKFKRKESRASHTCKRSKMFTVTWWNGSIGSLLNKMSDLEAGCCLTHCLNTVRGIRSSKLYFGTLPNLPPLTEQKATEGYSGGEKT